MKKRTAVYNVTSLPESPEVDRDNRFKVYAWSMLIRLVSIPLIFVVPMPWAIIPILFAVFIPAFAVVAANASNAPLASEIVSPVVKSIKS